MIMKYKEAFRQQLMDSKPFMESSSQVHKYCYFSREQFQDGDIMLKVDIPTTSEDKDITHYRVVFKSSVLEKKGWDYILPPDTDIPFLLI